MPNILAFAESRGGELRRATLESVTSARALAQGGEVHAVLFAAAGAAQHAATLAKYGASVVFVCEHAAFANYAPETLAATIADRVSTGGYGAAVFVASVLGKDLGPRVAAKLR